MLSLPSFFCVARPKRERSRLHIQRSSSSSPGYEFFQSLLQKISVAARDVTPCTGFPSLELRFETVSCNSNCRRGTAQESRDLQKHPGRQDCKSSLYLARAFHSQSPQGRNCDHARMDCCICRTPGGSLLRSWIRSAGDAMQRIYSVA